MVVYSSLLALALVVSSPWWLWRMATSGRYRAGLAGRLGFVPRELDGAIAKRGAAKGLVWLHAVSVGEVLAAERLVAELAEALPGYLLVVSATTAAGYKVAEEKLGVPVFYFPLDFAFVVRRYLRALRPSLFCTMESELWPRMLVECERAGVPVAVVNARVSDRSFPRYMRLRRLWRPLMGKVLVFLAQGEETAERLRAIGAERVRVTGNLKYDLKQISPNRVADVLRTGACGRKVVVAGSTVETKSEWEETFVLQAMGKVWESQPDVLLVLAPRHPQRFDLVYSIAEEHGVTRATDLLAGMELPKRPRQTVLLNTVGDLAAVYELADVAFVGGSLVAKGGHNPLEAARFGVPVVMGRSYENFREIVEGMQRADAIRILEGDRLADTLLELMANDRGTGERGRVYFEHQRGAVGRTVEALVELMR